MDRPDIAIQEKLFDMSSILYNKGLFQAKKRNLSGAVLTLTESLHIDKRNTEARNLLGLIYFELGLIGDAVKHWVISSNLQRQDNKAIAYLSDIQVNSSDYERMNEAVKAYNMALEYMEHESDDLVILRLKKAIELSPTFVNAINFLTFCYLIQKNSRAALPLIEQALSVDEGNETALRYYKTITGAKMKAAAAKASDAQKEVSAPPEPLFIETRTVKPEGSRHAKLLNDIIFFAIGVIIAIGVMYALVMPATIQSGIEREEALAEDIIALNYRHAAETAALSEWIEELEEEAETHEETIAAQLEQLAYFQNMHTVTTAQWLLDDGNLVGAAEIIYTVNLEQLPFDVLSKAEAIIDATYSHAAARLYDDGIAAYTAGNHAEAKVLLENALRFATHLNSNLDSIYYHLGSTERWLGNTAAAADFFRVVLNEHPDSPMFSRAYEALGQL